MQKMNVKAWCFSAIALVALFLVGCGRSNAASVDLKTLVARSEAHHAMEQAEKEKLAQMALLN
ncbi:hypothetical protein, partial [Allofustis seminis]|uniref:hypothetical protein n=1 Tax=Allofustis seminis TaxID=166939 RepID=UPI00047667E1